MHGTPGGLQLFTNENACFSPLFLVKNFFKMINLFAIFASEDGKQLLSRLYVAIFKFSAEKCPKDAEYAEVGKSSRARANRKLKNSAGPVAMA